MKTTKSTRTTLQPVPLVNRRRVLVVDENVEAANSIAQFLRLAGYEVHTANDGFTAVEAARRLRPEFLLLDLSLPGIDGYKVASVLRRDPGLRTTRIIGVTRHGLEEEQRQRSRMAGVDLHLVKPVDPFLLESLLVPRHPVWRRIAGASLS